MQVDLAFFPKENIELPEWTLGDVRCLPPHKENAIWVIDNLVRNSNAEFTLVWDMALGEPKIDLINHLAKGKMDVWHAGLKFGLQNCPKVIDYVYPTWIYNIDADDTIISSSFRIGFQCFMFRNSLWLRQGGADPSFDSLQMVGLDLGYRWLRSGALIRYHPDLVNPMPIATPILSLEDELRFARKYFSSKWVKWTLFRLLPSYGMSALAAWWRTRKTLHQHLDGSLNVRFSDFNPTPMTVSVLVPTLDRYPYLFNELVQLESQSMKPLEVLVTDQTEESQRRCDFLDCFPGLRIRYFPQSERGQCVAWNKLLAEAEGEAVLFLGDDADAIHPDFIHKLVSTMRYYEADIVAAHVEELTRSNESSNHIRLSDTFPICLVKRKLLEKTGHMDLVYNRDIRADRDLAIRCHQQGALILYDYSCVVFHHHAPVGGLRAHGARVITRTRSKKMVKSVLLPTISEMYLKYKYFTAKQAREDQMIRITALLFMQGGWLKRFARMIYILLLSPKIALELRRRKRHALSLLESRT